jgi:hypothetical protein
MRKILLALLALATALAIAPAAEADTFYFSFFGLGMIGGGSLNGSPMGNGQFNITGGDFTINGLNATIVANPNAPGVPPAYGNYQGWAFVYDNFLTPGGAPALDNDGLLFVLANGGCLNVYSVGNALYWNEFVNGQWLFDPSGDGELLCMDVSTTPEPSTLSLFGTGLLCLAGCLFAAARRRALRRPILSA